MPLEPISAETILTRLNTREIGRNIRLHSKVSSTMDVALQEVLVGAPYGTTIIAEVQEEGKGRLNRGWISPLGGVYVSIILYPPQALLSSLTMIAGLAVTDCIEEVSGIKATVKWPNDVLIDGKKVSGILAQGGSSPTKGCYAIIGVGINVDMDLFMHPEIANIATCLSAVTGRPVSSLEVICGLLESFENRYLALQSGEPLWKEWGERLVTLGQQVSVKSHKAVFEGIAESVSSDGSLLLRQDDGKLIEIPAGDVTLRV